MDLEAFGAKQGDQKIGGKITQFLDKVAKTVAEPKKNAKTSSSKLNLKVKRSASNLSKLLKYLKQTIFVPRKSPGPLKSSQNFAQSGHPSAKTNARMTNLRTNKCSC